VASISVIMPVRNGVAYVRSAIDSVLSQSFSDFWFIIVDDGSTDGLSDVVESYRDDRIRFVRFEQPVGICGALNRGIDAAETEYIARMDADDVCYPDRLAIQHAYMEQHPDVGLCGSWVRLFGDSEAERIRRMPTNPEWVRAYALFDNPHVHSSMLLRRSFMDRHGLRYDDAFARAEDYDLWTRAMDHFAGVNLRQVLLRYRIHEQSVTTRALREMDAAAVRVVSRHLQKLDIPISQEDLLFHRYLGTNRLYPDRTRRTICKAADWLHVILDANDRTGVYDASLLRRVVSDVWYGVCYHSLPLGSWVVAKYFTSRLTAGSPQGGATAAVFLAAAVKSFLRAGSVQR